MPLALTTALAFVLPPLVDGLQRGPRLPEAALAVCFAILAPAALVAWDIVVVVGDQAVAAAAHAPRTVTEAVRGVVGAKLHASART